jgi:hypothetical protein
MGSMKEKIRISEDDIKTIFHLLEEQEVGKIEVESIDKLKNT